METDKRRQSAIVFAPAPEIPKESEDNSVILQFSRGSGHYPDPGLGRRALEILSQLYHQPDSLSDVALLLEGNLVKCHKFVLSMSSPYFKKVFEVSAIQTF